MLLPWLLCALLAILLVGAVIKIINHKNYFINLIGGENNA